MNVDEVRVQLLVQILEHVVKTSQGPPIDAKARASCARLYIQLCSLNPDEPIDRYLTLPSTGALYKLHLPASPEGFLSQLILPIVVHRDSSGICELASTLTECLQDEKIHSRVKLNILNVENRLLRQSVVTELPIEKLSLGRDFCATRRDLVLDVVDNPSSYFKSEDPPLNDPILHALHGLYVDTERDLYLHMGQGDAVMPFYAGILTANRARTQVVARTLRSAIVANQRAGLITIEAMREIIDRYRESLSPGEIDDLDRMVEYHEAWQEEIQVRGLTIKLANTTFQGIDLSQVYTVLRFVLPFDLKDGMPEARKSGVSPFGRYEIILRQIQSVYEDPMMIFLTNIGSEMIGGLPCSFFSDVNPAIEAGSALVVVLLDGCVALDFDINPEGAVVEKTLEDERAIRGGLFFPDKEFLVNFLRALYREAPDQFPLKCELESLHIDAFSNYLIEYHLKGPGNILLHQKSYVLTSRDSFDRARVRYSDKISGLYREDEGVSLKALLENSTIRTNESLRDFVYKAIELTVKNMVESHSCWGYLWTGDPR
jgi:hypothetical protein